MAAPEPPIEVIAATCDMAHDWGSTRVVPQLKVLLSGQPVFKDQYLLKGLTYPRGPETYFTNYVTANPSFYACDISVFPQPITDLSAYPTANYFCIKREDAETRDASSGNTIFTPAYMNFLSNFFGTYRRGTLQVVDPSKGAGMVFVEDAQSFGDWAFDTLPPGVNPPYPAEDKPPRGIAGPAQVLDSASVSSSWFKNISSSGVEPEGIGRWTVDMSGAIPENQYIWKDEIRVPRQVKLTLANYPGGVQQIVFPAKMTSGPSLRVLSALMCAYLKKMGTPGTNIRNYMIDLLQYVPPVPPAVTGTRKKLKSDMMDHVNFLAARFDQLIELRHHDFNLKLIAFLKYVGDKGQNIYAGGIGATAGTTGDRISAPSYVLFGNTPAIYRDGKKNHVFICPPRLASVVVDEDLRTPKYQFLRSVYTRVNQIIDWVSRVLHSPTTGGAYSKDPIREDFISRGKAILGLIQERKQLNVEHDDARVTAFLKSLDDKAVTTIKANVKESLIFNVIRANYVTFTDDDLVPDDIDEFVSGYRPIKDDETGADLDLVPDATGDDKAEEITGEDPEVLRRYYRDNYSVLLEPPENPPLVAFTIKQQADIWEEIIFNLTIQPPGTPPRRPRADDATQRDSVGRSGDAESQLSVGPAPAPGSPPVSAPGSVARGSIIPGSGSQSDASSDAVPPQPEAKRARTGETGGRRLRFTIRRRSETRQTKKNRRRKVIEVSV